MLDLRWKPIERSGASVETLYEQYLVSVFQYISVRIKDNRTAEDLTLGVLKKAFSGFKGGVRDEENLAVNIFTQARKAAQSRVEPESPTDCPEDTPDRGQFRECLVKLSPPEQEIMALKLCSGLNNRCIGRVLGLSESEAGRQIGQALIRMNGNSG